jgi:membrane protein DedA with SNARE-associated domain
MEGLLVQIVGYQHLLVFVGVLLEGEIALFAAAAMAYQGFFDIYRLVLLGALAAAVGDNAFYWLGRSQRCGTKHPWAAAAIRFIGEHRLFKGEEFLRRHGGKSVFLVRFLYGLRLAGAMTAGYLGMTFLRFLLFNLSAAFSWAALISALGYSLTGGLKLIAGATYWPYLTLSLSAAVLFGVYLFGRYRKRKRTPGRQPTPPGI